MEIELMRNIVIGQYLPLDSPVHRLDPRAKILCALALVVAVSVSRSIIASVILLAAIMGITALARLPFGYILQPFTRGWPFILFFLVISLLYLGWQEPAGQIYFQWSFIRITRNALQLIALSWIRVLSFVFLISLPSLTTPLTKLTHGVELLLLPFRRIGVPAHEIALVNMIALRFVPTLAEELERIIKAQISRCGEIGNLKLQRPDRMARVLVPLVVPLFVNAFRRAEELAIAMEARGYAGGKGRSKYFVLESTLLDKAVVVGMIAFCAAVLLTQWPALHTLVGLS